MCDVIYDIIVIISQPIVVFPHCGGISGGGEAPLSKTMYNIVTGVATYNLVTGAATYRRVMVLPPNGK